MSDRAESPAPPADRSPSPADVAGLVDFSHEAVVVYDRAFCIQYANAEAQRQMGLPWEGLIGNVLWELFPATVGPYHEPLTRAMRERVPVTFQTYYAPNDAWAEGRCVPVEEWGAQREPALAVFFRDVTQQKRAADKAQSLQRVSAALVGALTQAEVAQVIVAEAMPALDAGLGLVAALSEDGAEFQTLGLAGYPPELADAWRTFPADSPTPMADAVRGGQPVLLETLAARRARYPHLEDIRAAGGPGGLAALPLLADGRAIGGLVLVFRREDSLDAEGRAFLLTMAGLCAQALGRARLLSLAQREVEERQRAETSLRESEQRLRLALDGGSLGSWHWELATGMVEWAPATKALFGLPPDAPVPHEGVLSVLHPDDRERVDAALRRAIAGGADYDVEYRVRWPDGSLHWLASRGRVYRDKRGAAKTWKGSCRTLTRASGPRRRSGRARRGTAA